MSVRCKDGIIRAHLRKEVRFTGHAASGLMLQTYLRAPDLKSDPEAWKRLVLGSQAVLRFLRHAPLKPLVRKLFPERLLQAMTDPGTCREVWAVGKAMQQLLPGIVRKQLGVKQLNRKNAEHMAALRQLIQEILPRI